MIGGGNLPSSVAARLDRHDRIDPRPNWGRYFAYRHSWFMNWGTTSAEQRMSLPGGPLLPFVSSRFTRAVTILAPPSAVWPWLLQMGQDRAGFYSNTWLENLTGSNIHNPNTVHAE